MSASAKVFSSDVQVATVNHVFDQIFRLVINIIDIFFNMNNGNKYVHKFKCLCFIIKKHFDSLELRKVESLIIKENVMNGYSEDVL